VSGLFVFFTVHKIALVCCRIIVSTLRNQQYMTIAQMRTGTNIFNLNNLWSQDLFIFLLPYNERVINYLGHEIKFPAA